ncbi:MAG: UDP-N-acetylmuramoyl-L-alanyl-D-glutamate--2,6-diaminopimelate ligase [Lachnospiraceae bacterium]|nr:UDP-N-acetylmuramoyl-L-alanyl-D-glutamate--2,6-diaminopimelate ligase [Lachnospiraceae bacterium]
MAYLKELLKDVTYVCTKGTPNIRVTHICHDSRQVQKGSMFLCLMGAREDGHRYLDEAVRRGAAVCVVSRNVYVKENVTVIRVRDTSRALAVIAGNFYGRPAERMTVIGITGTKGKTTTAYMLWRIMNEAGISTGLMGTLGIQFPDGRCLESSNTTPDALVIQSHLRKMADAGCTCCVMEVSSQGLKHHRVDGIAFALGIFTNLSEDHIGPAEHKNMTEYARCKKMLLARSRCVLLNADDTSARFMASGIRADLFTYGLGRNTDFGAQDIRYYREGARLAMAYRIKGCSRQDIRLGMPGQPNVYNSLAAFAAAHLMGIDDAVTVQALSRVRVKGRIEEVESKGDYHIIVDYAHNAVSLEELLHTLRLYEPKRLVVLFGCGGNRSPLRRIQMGQVAGRLADMTILTSDNPRDEDPLTIISHIRRGMEETGGSYRVIPDRREAIAYAVTHALTGDMIVVTGKGHEAYQEIAGRRYPMDDRRMIEQMIESHIRGE